MLPIYRAQRHAIQILPGDGGDQRGKCDEVFLRETQKSEHRINPEVGDLGFRVAGDDQRTRIASQRPAKVHRRFVLIRLPDAIDQRGIDQQAIRGRPNHQVSPRHAELSGHRPPAAPGKVQAGDPDRE